MGRGGGEGRETRREDGGDAFVRFEGFLYSIYERGERRVILACAGNDYEAAVHAGRARILLFG